MALKASIVVPVYNKASYLKECLESIFCQTFSGFELIAVDDASTDNSLEILNAFKDPRLRVIQSANNQGPGLAMQQAMDQAQGEYIIRVDADDVLLLDRFQKQIAFMDAHPDIGISGTNIQVLGEEEVIRRPMHPDACEVQLLFGVAVMQPTSIYRRSEILEHGLRFDDNWPYYGEDWMFQARAARFLKFANLNEVTVLYRRGSQGVSFGRERSLDLPECINFAFQEFGWSPLSEAEMKSHLWSINVFNEPPTGYSVKQFRAWLNTLESINTRTGCFDADALHERVQDAWHQLLYQLPQHGTDPIFAYLLEGGGLDLRRTYFVLSTMLATAAKPRKNRK